MAHYIVICRHKRQEEIAMVRAKHILVLSALALLAACGTDPGERALSGAGIGAAGGAVTGAAFGNPLAGAVVGGVAGAATGGLTKPSQINLDR
jgi:osmotically inducible lipoprotein OsmB